MEALVLKVLKKTLRIFIKNFSEDSFSLQAMKGEGTIQNLDLNEQVIQEMLMIPPNLQVVRSQCDLLSIKVPWTSYKSQPTVLHLNNIDIDLREPETVQPMPTLLKQMRRKNKRNEITENMQIGIKLINITIQALGGPLVMIQLEDILIQSTNGKWEPGNLNEIRMVNKDQKTEHVHKLLTVGAISLSILSQQGTHALLTRMPLTIHMAQRRSTKDWSLLSANVEFIFEHVILAFTQSQWWAVQDLVKGFQACMARPVPPEDLAATAANAKKDKDKDKSKEKEEDGDGSNGKAALSYHLHLERWMVEFIEDAPAEAGKRPGYSLAGEGLHFSFSAGEGVAARIDSPGTNGVPDTVPIYETIVSVVVAGFSFQEFSPASWKNPLHTVLVSRRETATATGLTLTPRPTARSTSHDDMSSLSHSSAHAFAGNALLKATIILRRPIVTEASAPHPHPHPQPSDAAPTPPIIGVEVNLQVGQLQLVTDRPVWKKFILFIAGRPGGNDSDSDSESVFDQAIDIASPSVLEGDASPSTREKARVAQERLGKLKSKLMLGDQWSSQIKVHVKATDLRVIVPSEAEGVYKHMSVYLDLGALIMGNHSDWKHTPHLQRAITLIHAPSPPPPASVKQQSFAHKLTFQLENMSCNVHTTPDKSDQDGNDGNGSGNGNGGVQISPILPPASVRLYVRYFTVVASTGATLRPTPHMELVLHSGELNLDATKKHIHLLQFIGRKYLDPRKIAGAMKARVKKAGKAAADKLGIVGSPGSPGMLVPKAETLRPLKQKVGDALNAYKWTIYIHIERGVFKLPINSLLVAGSSAAQSDPLADATDAAQPEAAAAELKFGAMDLALENSLNGQTIVMSLGTFQATGLEHAKFPTSLNLIPMPYAPGDALPMELSEGENLQFRYKRRRKLSAAAVSSAAAASSGASEQWTTEVWGRLQGMQVKVQRRPGFVKSPTAGMGLPDMQAMVNKVVATIQSRQEDIDALKQNVKEIDFDVRWGFELGNCEVLLGDASEGEDAGAVVYKPTGLIRISDSNRSGLIKLNKALEEQVLQARMSLATMEQEKEDKDNRIAELEDQLAKLRVNRDTTVAKWTDDYQNVEMRLVQAKMSMAEQQMENDNLRSALKRYEKK